MPEQCLVTFYGISTCPHCRKAKEYLEGKNIAFDCVFVDLLEGQEREAVMEQVKEHNPKFSFPTMVFGNSSKVVVVGFKADEIDGAIENAK